MVLNTKFLLFLTKLQLLYLQLVFDLKMIFPLILRIYHYNEHITTDNSQNDDNFN